VIIAAVFRTSLPDDERLDVELLVRDVNAGGVRARTLPGTARIIETITREAAPGDVVVIMSNGGFDNIHQRLLEALGGR
jgi:UDP-N-acetylmuramate: L-alanyl-gamma-D-glutamyl-meso-diaminopimelate ligase